jgi:ADP-ribose pyrophosphatase YjhB (NUDIX family)
MSTQADSPIVGVGIIIENSDGKILVGKRKGSHAPYFSIPGGSLEMGETFEGAAIREVQEETNLTISNPQVIAVANNLKTFKEEGIHSVSIILHTNTFSGELEVMEPAKCEEWMWCDPQELPQPHFDASEQGVGCFLKNKLYIG